MKFSIILPNYNRAQMLRRAIQSVLSQTHQDWECFIIDDGSTDESSGVLCEFSPLSDPRLHIFRFSSNEGQHKRRNLGLTLAHGDFVSFLDSDDVWLPERLATFADYIAKRPQVDFWFSNGYVSRYGKTTGCVFDPEREIAEGVLPGWYAVGDRLPYLTSNLAIRRSFFEKVGYFREDMKVLEDTELYARMIRDNARVGVIRAPLAIRHEHDGQITRDHETCYSEAVMALRSGGIPYSVENLEMRILARKTAMYLIKDLEPYRARKFMLEHLGLSWMCLLTLIPRPLLWVAKQIRKQWMIYA